MVRDDGLAGFAKTIAYFLGTEYLVRYNGRYIYVQYYKQLDETNLQIWEDEEGNVWFTWICPDGKREDMFLFTDYRQLTDLGWICFEIRYAFNQHMHVN